MRCEAGVCRNRAVIECCGVHRCARCMRGHVRLVHPEWKLHETLQESDPPLFQESMDCNVADDQILFDAMDRSSMMTWITDPEPRTLHVSPALVAYTGIPARDWLGSGWAAYVHPDDLAKILEVIQQGFRDRKPYTFSFRLRRIHGYNQMRNDGAPRYRPDGTFAGFIGTVSIVATVRDPPDEPPLREGAQAE